MVEQKSNITFMLGNSEFTSMKELAIEDQTNLLNHLKKWREKVEQLACEHYLSTRYSQDELEIVYNDE